jgi:hypothetical protein
MKRYAPLLSIPLLIGCSSSDATSSSATTTGGATDPSTLSFDLDSYTVKPGEEKKYLCYTFNLPADGPTTLDEITPIYGKATHHIGVYYTFPAEKEGKVFECPELVRDNWIALYVGGIDSGSLKMPQGTGSTLVKGQQILVQLHLLNTTTETITDHAQIQFHTTKEKVIPAGIYGFDDRAVKIPAQAKDFEQGMDCPSMSRDMDVFAVFGHMHRYGKSIEMSRGKAPGDEVIYKAPWTFNDQPTTPMSFHIKKGDDLHLRCWYDNPDAMDVAYGESTFNEMCSFIFYYTPYDALDGCVKTAP